MSVNTTVTNTTNTSTPIYWVYKFQDDVVELGGRSRWTSLLNRLVMMGVDAPELMSDDCRLPTPVGQRISRVARLNIKRGKRRYNRRVWTAMTPEVRKQLRKALLRDLRTETDSEGYGKISHKGYARRLIEHFLVDRPNPEWVGRI
jgi:hypothetical protein